MAWRRPRQGVGPEGVSHDDDDANLSRHADLGARTARGGDVGPWLLEPVLDTAALAPDSRTELAEDLSIALSTLDRLSPLERAAFLLHDVFDFSFSEVATALERSVEACRQLGARARAHVRATRPRGVD